MRKIVFTFDDSLKSHLTIAAPELKKYNFRATFFVTGAKNLWQNLPDQYEEHLTWQQIKQLHQEGHEIGNHTMHHNNPTAVHPEIAEKDIVELNEKLISLNIEKPISYAYPGYFYNDTVQEILMKNGFLYSRIGYLVRVKANERKEIFYYTKEHKNNLLINCTGIMDDCIYDFSYFVKDIENAPVDSVPIINCHGLKLNFTINTFKQALQYLYEHQWQVVPLKEIE